MDPDLVPIKESRPITEEWLKDILAWDTVERLACIEETAYGLYLCGHTRFEIYSCLRVNLVDTESGEIVDLGFCIDQEHFEQLISALSRMHQRKG